ncbi:MAG TPA: SIMPL domain-containing protein [Candidatus Caenarcaniphilales bacterium]
MKPIVWSRVEAYPLLSTLRQQCHYLTLWPALLLSLTLGAPAALAQEKQLKTLTVTGRGTETVPTTLAQVRLGVEAQGKTAQAVQQEIARRSSAVVALLKSRNVQRLETTGISLNPNYRDNKGTQQLVGYIGSNTVSFRIATERSGALLDEAVQAGATRIEGINFIAADQALSTAQQQALREAVQDAQAQANAVLKALNLTQGEVVSIQLNNAAPPPPIYALENRGASLMKADRAPTPVVGGEQEVEATVTLQINY